MKKDAKTDCRCPFCDGPVEKEPSICSPCGAGVRYCPACGKPIPHAEESCPSCAGRKTTNQRREK